MSKTVWEPPVSPDGESCVRPAPSGISTHYRPLTPTHPVLDQACSSRNMATFLWPLTAMQDWTMRIIPYDVPTSKSFDIFKTQPSFLDDTIDRLQVPELAGPMKINAICYQWHTNQRSFCITLLCYVTKYKSKPRTVIGYPYHIQAHEDKLHLSLTLGVVLYGTHLKVLECQATQFSTRKVKKCNIYIAKSPEKLAHSFKGKGHSLNAR